MYLGMAAAAFFCVFFGVAPGRLYDMLPYPVHFVPYTIAHLVEISQAAIFTFAAFWIFRKQVAGEVGITLDVDWLYRRPARWARRIFVEDLDAAFDKVEALGVDVAVKLAALSKNPMRIFSGSDGEFFSPDAYRPKIHTLILLVLLVFVLISVLGLLNHLLAVTR
jgi:multicomponent Na+:H+ antiporter subunit D